MKVFNLVLTGVGGQGILTLTKILAESALNQGFEVKTSELHGLAQRGGHIECHVRFGDKVYSPLVRQGEADLILALEPVEALRACYYASKLKTIFLVNTYKIIPPTSKNYPTLKKIRRNLSNFGKEVIFLDASDTVRKHTGSIVATNIYMLGYSIGKKLIPIREASALIGIRKIIPKKYVEMNEFVFKLGKEG